MTLIMAPVSGCVLMDRCLITVAVASQYRSPLLDNGYVQKAVNYDGEMFIIEEVQLWENQVPISVLRLLPSKVGHNSVLHPHVLS